VHGHVEDDGGVGLALADRVHDNLMQTSAWMGEARGGAVHRDSGELLFASGSELPFLNGVMRRRSEDDADGLLGRAKDFFFSRSRGFVIFTWPETRRSSAPRLRRDQRPCWSAIRRWCARESSIGFRATSSP
jgi:hypothetical protein